MSGTITKYLLLLFLWLNYFWTLYLNVRQYILCEQTSDVPPHVKEVMSRDHFDKSRLFTIEMLKYSFVRDTVSILSTTVVITTGLLAKMWNISKLVSPFQGEISVSCIWLFMLVTLWTLGDLPFATFKTFVLEEQHGFNKQTFGFFVLDNLKMFMLEQSVAFVISPISILFVKYCGDTLFISIWVASVLTFILLYMIYEAYVLPFFYHYTLLPEGELRNEIQQLVSELNFPLKEIYIVEEAPHTSYTYTYLHGLLGKKDIVFFKTLLAKTEDEGLQNEEILAALSHQLGHWNHNHTLKLLIIDQTDFLLQDYVYSFMFNYPPMYTAVGFQPDVEPSLVGLIIVIQYILLPYNTLMFCLFNYFKKYFELQADNYAKSLGKAKSLQKALIHLNKNNLQFPIHDPLYFIWNVSHPTLVQRVQALESA